MSTTTTKNGNDEGQKLKIERLTRFFPLNYKDKTSVITKLLINQAIPSVVLLLMILLRTPAIKCLNNLQVTASSEGTYLHFKERRKTVNVSLHPTAGLSSIDITASSFLYMILLSSLRFLDGQ